MIFNNLKIGSVIFTPSWIDETRSIWPSSIGIVLGFTKNKNKSLDYLRTDDVIIIFQNGEIKKFFYSIQNNEYNIEYNIPWFSSVRKSVVISDQNMIK